MAEREPKEAPTKTYKEMSTGRVETAVVGSDVEKALIEQGYVEIDAETGEVKDKGAAAKAAAGTVVKPLNPDAQVATEADVAAAKEATEPPPPAPASPPAVPKKLNREADKPLMLSAADLAYMRDTQALTLTERAIVTHRGEWVDDGMGGGDYATTYTGAIPCRIAPMRVQAAEALVGGQLQGQLPWEITIPFGVTIDVNDRINVGGSLAVDVVTGGRWFEILAKYSRWTSETACQLLCAERGEG